jgi:electron transfer flavoprotein beta subunit
MIESSGIHISTDLRADQEIQPLAVAKVLEFLAKREKVDAVILGKQAIDGDNCQTGPMCAALLGWPQCTFAAALRADPDSTSSAVMMKMIAFKRT